jgi:hypothetical protein
MIVERTLSDWVTCQQQFLLARIPQGKCVITVQAIQRCRAPAFYAGKKKIGVALVRATGVRHPQLLEQLLAIVEAKVGDQTPPVATSGEWLPIKPVFGKTPI